MNETQEQSPSAHVGQIAAEFMDYLDETSEPGATVEAALIAVWTSDGAVAWHVEPDEESGTGRDEGTAKLAVALGEAALDSEPIGED
jgi:alkylated DNA repair dioxygenase AlkB